MEQTAPPILKLSADIISLIFDELSPEYHFSFASTCKSIAQSSERVFQRHREACRKYRVISDLDPATVPTVLRSACGLSDPMIAWHVRSIEIWRDRFSLDEWRVFDCEDASRKPSPTAAQADYLTAEELSFYYDQLADYIPVTYFRASDCYLGLESLFSPLKAMSSEDGALKALLIAVLPRLEDVKFITSQHDDGSTLCWLEILLVGEILAPGFKHIRNVAVGIWSDTWLDDIKAYPTYPGSPDTCLLAERTSSFVVRSLLRFPNIHSLYLNNFEKPEHDPGGYLLGSLPIGSSSVKHVFLDNCHNLTGSMQSLLVEPPWWLESVAFRFDSTSRSRIDDVNDIIQKLGRYHEHCLESLMFYGVQEGHNPWDENMGYRCSAYSPLNFERYYLREGSLKNFSVNWEQIESDAYHHDKKVKDFDHWMRFVEETFPEHMERIVLLGRSPSNIDTVEMFVLALMKCGTFSSLRAIYLEQVEGIWTARNPDDEGKIGGCFQKAMELGKELGIEVHTLTSNFTPDPERVLPRAPDKYDLVTGPYKGLRPENFGFDVYLGRDVPLDAAVAVDARRIESSGQV